MQDEHALTHTCCRCVPSPRLSLPVPRRPDEPDILDESIAFFRANVMFRTFQSQGPADLTLAYFTAFIAEVLRFFQKQKTKEEAKKKLTELSMSQNFPIPGDKTFALAGFFAQPASRAESDSFRQYFRQAREELCNRLVDIAYDEKGAQNKWQVTQRSTAMRTRVRPPLFCPCRWRCAHSGTHVLSLLCVGVALVVLRPPRWISFSKRKFMNITSISV